MRAIPYGSPEYCAAIAQEADYEKRKAEGYERGLRDENAHLRAQLAEANRKVRVLRDALKSMLDAWPKDWYSEQREVLQETGK